jgi:hypothetical protein
MGWKRQGQAQEFAQAPAGAHTAVLVAVVQLGTQTHQFPGKPATSQEDVYLAWELTDAVNPDDGANLVVQVVYNFTLGKTKKGSVSNLRKLLEGWAGKSFDVAPPQGLGPAEDFELPKLLGRKCMVNIVEKDGYNKVDSVSTPHASMAANMPAPTRTPFCWEITEPLSKIPDWLPYSFGKSVLEIASASKELAGTAQPAAANGATGQTAAAPAEDTLGF